MSKLKWDEIGKRLYETGASKAVLFPQGPTGAYTTGIAWNGMVSVKQSPDGAEETAKYADNIKYLSMFSSENFKGTIDAFTYPDEFAKCDGSAELVAKSGVYVGQQERQGFGLAYSTIIGSDTAGNSHGEKLHLIYNAKVSPSERAYETINETPNAITFSWGFTTTPVSVEDIETLNRPTAYVCIDSTKCAPDKFKAIKDLLYGTEAPEANSKLPTLAELVAILSAV